MNFDAIIIGGGPAGSSCALWLKLLGYNPCVIEQRDCLGGLLNDSPYLNSWMVDLPGLSGVEIAGNIQRNLDAEQIRCFFNSQVTDVNKSSSHFTVQFQHTQKTKKIKKEKNQSVSAPFVVVASGVRANNGGLQPTNNTLIGPGHHIANYDFTDQRVAILGGGDNAFENYAFVKNKGAKLVHIYAHSLRARKQFLQQTSNTDVFFGEYNVGQQTCQVAGKSYDVILVFYGWTPDLSFLKHFALEKNNKGFIRTQWETAETSEPGIYAIGEVTDRQHPCCVTAMADGVVAAKAIQGRLESSLYIPITL